MSDHPTFRKVLSGIATREQMLALFDHHRDDPGVDPLSGIPYAGEWFEIGGSDYYFMQGLLPPLPERIGMFGLSGYRAGNVTSILFSIRIRGRERWFHGFCDLSHKHSPDAMRAAIVARETTAADSMTREEKIEAIWAATHPDFRGIAGAADPHAWPPEHRAKRTIQVDAGGSGMVLKVLEDLTDDEIDDLFTVTLKSRRSYGGPGRPP